MLSKDSKKVGKARLHHEMMVFKKTEGRYARVTRAVEPYVREMYFNGLAILNKDCAWILARHLSYLPPTVPTSNPRKSKDSNSEAHASADFPASAALRKSCNDRVVFKFVFIICLDFGGDTIERALDSILRR